MIKILKFWKKNQILKIVYFGFCDFSDILRDFKLSFVSDDECGLKNLKTSSKSKRKIKFFSNQTKINNFVWCFKIVFFLKIKKLKNLKWLMMMSLILDGCDDDDDQKKREKSRSYFYIFLYHDSVDSVDERISFK